MNAVADIMNNNLKGTGLKPYLIQYCEWRDPAVHGEYARTTKYITAAATSASECAREVQDRKWWKRKQAEGLDPKVEQIWCAP